MCTQRIMPHRRNHNDVITSAIVEITRYSMMSRYAAFCIKKKLLYILSTPKTIALVKSLHIVLTGS